MNTLMIVLIVLLVLDCIATIWSFKMHSNQDEINKAFNKFAEKQEKNWKEQEKKWTENNILWNKYKHLEIKRLHELDEANQ